MQAAQEEKQDPQAKAVRVSLANEFGQDRFEELAGDATELIRSGMVQYWRLNNTIGIFTISVIPDVWQMETHFSKDAPEHPEEDLKAIVNAFWDEQKPEYITTVSPTTWPNIWLLQSAGFQQTGVLPLSDGPAITWGHRKCH